MVKTTKFKDPIYVGDPINTVRIFNEKEVDEIVFLDIVAGKERREPNYELLEDIAGEAFMPAAYGGGISEISQIGRILSLGVEKVIVNTALHSNPDFLLEAVARYGSQSIVASIDCRKTLFGKYEVYMKGGGAKHDVSLLETLAEVERVGCGEIFLNSIDRDGTLKGYDLDLIKTVSERVNLPVVACGGAADVGDFEKAVNASGASAVAAGAMFVFRGKHRAVLVSYPSREALTAVLP